MELFFCAEISSGAHELDSQESGHCIKVLRHRIGDIIHVIDGQGRLYECRLTGADPRACTFETLKVVEGYGSHPYRLTMAVAPPKNIDRFEWFCEKATEIGVDEIVPLVGDYSERRVFKGERCERILVSAAKQSHKGAIPSLAALTPVRDFLVREFAPGVRKFICYCGDVEGAERVHIGRALAAAGGACAVSSDADGSCVAPFDAGSTRVAPFDAGNVCADSRPAPDVGSTRVATFDAGNVSADSRRTPNAADVCADSRPAPDVGVADPSATAEFVIMIGPEGDFSREEMSLAVERGWQIISLGDSRLRIETAALTATAAVYLSCC